MNTPDGTDELHDAPVLRSISKEAPFVVPGGFFDAFPHAVQRLAHARPVERPWARALRNGWLRPALLTGAVAVAAFVLILRQGHPDLPPGTVAAESTWTEGELLHADVDVELLYTEFIPGTDLMDAVELPLDDDAVLAYLENEDLALDLLIEAL